MVREAMNRGTSKVFAVLVGLFAMVGAPLGAKAQSVDVSVLLPGGGGATFPVEIHLNTNGNDVTNGQVVLDFDSSLSFVSGVNDTGSGTWSMVSGNVPPFLSAGDVVLAVTSSGNPNVNGANVLVSSLMFTAQTSTPSVADFTLVSGSGSGTEFSLSTTPYTTYLPEPGTHMMLGAGSVLLGGLARRRRCLTASARFPRKDPPAQGLDA
jgi:hypothetical protein